MTCLLWAGGLKASCMDDCTFQFRVEVYHDGQLDSDGRRAVEQHIARCDTCAAQLAWLRSISRNVAATTADRITADESVRLHDELDEALDATERDTYSMSLYRTAGTLSAIAASILVLSCVWLNELPARKLTSPGGGAGTGVALAEVPAWERVAVNLRVDPMPLHPDGEVYLADARLANWMLEGLAGNGAGSNER